MSTNNLIKFLNHNVSIRNGNYNMNGWSIPGEEFPYGKFKIKYSDRDEFLKHYYTGF